LFEKKKYKQALEIMIIKTQTIKLLLFMQHFHLERKEEKTAPEKEMKLECEKQASKSD
jgi:hypothetical protein